MKYILDTNVAVTANRNISQEGILDDELACISNCIEVIQKIIKSNNLVLDAGDEIFKEYARHLNLSGVPGVGDIFFKWLHDHRWSFPEEDRVQITPNPNKGYEEFPDHPALDNFDPSDRKFIAVANKHPCHPMIYQAADSKWWIWKTSLKEVGICVKFVCPDYIKRKCHEKFGKL